MKILRNYLILSLAILTFSFVNVNAQSFSDKQSGRTLEQKVTKEILKLPRYGVFDHIAFTAEGGTVTLYGKVYNAINKSSAKNVVERIPGVERVVNNIEILPLSGFDDSIRINTYRSFARTGGLSRYLWEVNPSVRIIVDHGHVTLEGIVANQGDYNLLNIVAKGVPGSFSVQNNLIVDKERVR